MKDFVTMQRELIAEQRAAMREELESQVALTRAAERERDAERRRADDLEALLKATGKHHGLKYKFCKIFSLGFARCS